VDELDFIYEKHLKVFPTYAVIPFTSMLFSHVIPLTNINPAALLHGEQKIILHKPIPTSATVHATMCVDSIYDKGDKGAIINLTLETTDDAGEALFDNKVVLMDRSGGNFGGDRGPKTTPVVPPEGQDPDFSVAYTIPPDQAAIYRLSGDKNPLHIDPAYAQKARFDRPILHGLCSFGYAGRAIRRRDIESERQDRPGKHDGRVTVGDPARPATKEPCRNSVTRGDYGDSSDR